MLPPPSHPVRVARRLVADRFNGKGTSLIRAWRGTFWAWNGRCWPECDEASIRAAAYRYLEDAWYEGKDGPRPWEPTRAKIANVIEALRAVVHLETSVQPPVWLEGDGPDPRDLLVARNGIVHLPTRQLRAHDPRLFVTHAVPFDFDPEARFPNRWLAFLHDLWSDDGDSIALLQEVFGYVLSGDTSLQKILLLVGPTRAGKGVIANILRCLLGKESVGAPTLAGLTTNFGLQDLIGKTLAVVSDARLRPKTNVQALAERLLSISGEDAITIDRKYRDPWTGTLGIRFMLLTNELPRFSDASGALARRFVVAVLRETFYDRENPALLSELTPELPGILNWSLVGLDRLRAQRHFTDPASSRETIQDLEDLISPVSAFLRDRCQVHRLARVGVDHLWTEWKTWCDEQSQYHGTKQTFGRDLRAAVAGINVSRPRDGDHQRVYVGVGLRADYTDNADRSGPRGPSGPSGPSGPEIDVPGDSGEPRGPRGPWIPALISATATIRCSDYRGHQSSHRQLGARWICEACDPSA